MEGALQIWQEEGLPPLELKNPWYGYSLGSWTTEDEEVADGVTRGEYPAVGKSALRKK